MVAGEIISPLGAINKADINDVKKITNNSSKRYTSLICAMISTIIIMVIIPH